MFTIRDFQAKTVSWWFDQIRNIDFHPSYQRKGKLWTKKDQSYLIDSIFNGFDIPKLYIADFTFFNSNLNEKQKTYAVIDGKQRFDAIFSFYRNELELDKDFIFMEDPSIKLNGLSLQKIKELYPQIASKFENFNLSVVTVITDDKSMINELFIRLNKSKPLTGAELRNAMEGDVPKYTRQIIDHKFFKEKIRFNTDRGQDSNLATKLLLIEFRGKFVDTKRIHLDKLVQEAIVGAENFNIKPSFQNIIRVLNRLTEIFNDKDSLLNASGLIPVYYWFIRNNAKDYSNTMIGEYFRYFDRKRKESRDKNQNVMDSRYLIFDTLAKSLNDQASLQGCYVILLEKWKDYKKTYPNNE